ncbi:MAG: signal recognition particle protein, partial [Anaerolineales bacterium]|nr:signal recognition particle protein [Anaerolineales bacterium]
RILGMGDVIGLIEKAEEAFDQQTAEIQAQRMLSGEFTLEDFAEQLKQVQKLGPIGQILEMLPGGMGRATQMIDPHEAEHELKKTEAIINSMTPVERRNPKVLNASRRRRIANGSGTQVQDVNRLLKQFRDARRMMKTLKKTGLRGLPGIFG